MLDKCSRCPRGHQSSLGFFQCTWPRQDHLIRLSLSFIYTEELFCGAGATWKSWPMCPYVRCVPGWLSQLKPFKLTKHVKEAPQNWPFELSGFKRFKFRRLTCNHYKSMCVHVLTSIFTLEMSTWSENLTAMLVRQWTTCKGWGLGIQITVIRLSKLLE